MAIHPSYDPAWLDHQYNNRLHVPQFQDYLNRWERQSRETEAALPVTRDIRYGPLPRERLDIFAADTPAAKTLLFIHGGYWHLFDKTLFYFLARSFRARGITTLLLNYPRAPEHTPDQMVLSCRRAVQWLYHHGAAYGAPPHQLYVAGHSAGGHLAAMLLATDWSRSDAGVPANGLKGAVLVSGLFDLEPIRLSYINQVLAMDEAMAARNSPLRLQPRAGCPVVVAVGQQETAAFQDQSRGLYEAWKEKAAMQLLVVPGANHFSVVEMGDELQTAIFGLMAV